MTTSEILHALCFGFPVPAESVDSAWPVFLQRGGGLLLSLLVTGAALVLAALPALALALAKEGSGRAPVPAAAGAAAGAFTSVVQGLPVLLLVLLAFHLSYPLTGHRLPSVLIATAAFAVYAAAYLAQALRAGLRAVDPGFVDAARVLGLSPARVLLHVRLPVALRAALPALLGVAITVWKDTSILVVVGVPELTFTAKQLVVNQPADHLLILVFLVLAYGGGAALASAGVRRLDRRLKMGREA